ncbi:MAG: hypothetical protein VW362_11560 [Candidatus Nanopelagicales bacterium]|jgi:hypothetical protein
MVPVMGPEPTPGFVTALRFHATDPVALLGHLRSAIELLATFDGFVDARLARAVDEGDLISMTLGWTTVGAYRRALSSYDVKVSVVPLLSLAVDEPTAYEVLQVTDEHGTITASGTLAADAGTVSLGHAAAERVAPEPS